MAHTWILLGTAVDNLGRQCDSLVFSELGYSSIEFDVDLLPDIYPLYFGNGQTTSSVITVAFGHAEGVDGPLCDRVGYTRHVLICITEPGEKCQLAGYTNLP